MSFQAKTRNPDFSLVAYPWIPGQARNDTVSLQSRKSSEARVMIGLLAFDGKSATIREVGNVFNRDDSTIRFAVHQLKRRLRNPRGSKINWRNGNVKYLLEVSNFQAGPHF